jgi:hypothetical protein
MEIPEEQQQELESLIEFGEKLEAIRYAQKTIGLDAETAISLVEELEAKLETEEDKELAKTIKDLETSTSKLPNIVGGIFGGIGIILLLLAGYFGYRMQTFLETAVSVPGVVKEYRETQVRNKEDNTINTVLSPVLDYHYDGKDYTFISPYSSAQSEYQIGAQIPLLIDPKLPGKPDADTFFDKWFVTILLGSIGLVFSGIGLLVVRAFRKA